MRDGSEVFYFDTYALVELEKGNPAYSKYKDAIAVTTLLNLMEFYTVLLKLADKKLAEIKFKIYLDNCVNITPSIVKDAAEFRLKFVGKTGFKISYVDAIGYLIAKNLGIRFLTGDNAFKNLDNVEFVK